MGRPPPVSSLSSAARSGALTPLSPFDGVVAVLPLHLLPSGEMAVLSNGPNQKLGQHGGRVDRVLAALSEHASCPRRYVGIRGSAGTRDHRRNRAHGEPGHWRTVFAFADPLNRGPFFVGTSVGGPFQRGAVLAVGWLALNVGIEAK